MNTDYKANFVISQFSFLEQQLRDCMEYVPYIETNKGIISPKFVSIIMESCSLIDSIFHEISGTQSERFNLKKYSELHESSLKLEENITLFLNTPLRIIRPYADWTKKQPAWWNAYNKVKHNRLNNIDVATFENAVFAIAGLHQIIARNSIFISGFLKSGWIDTNEVEIIEGLSAVAHVGVRHYNMVVESKLFVSSTMENFINDASDSEPLYLDVDYEMPGLSNRVRNFIFAHEEF